MAEQHYKDTRAAKAAQDSCDENADGPGAGYRFDLELCRRTFDAYDRDGSGFLDITELTELAEVRLLTLRQASIRRSLCVESLAGFYRSNSTCNLKKCKLLTGPFLTTTRIELELGMIHEMLE
jgi:hypothetical protein